MKCPKCGKRIAGKVNFCPYCGYKDENGAMGGSKVGGLKEKISNMPPEKKKKLKLATIITRVSLVVLIVVIILAVTLSSIFRLAKVKKVELGMTKAQVEKILGTPNDIDDAYVPVAGGDIDVYLYYESKVARILKQIDKNADSDVDDWDDLEKALEKEEKLYDKLEKMKYKSIVIGFDRTTERVVSVAFNTKTQFSKSNPYYSWGTKELKEFSLNKTTLSLNEDLYAGDFWYTSTYKDGSYRMEYIQYLQGFSTEEEGRKTPTLDNGWMTKQLSLEVKTANVIAESANANWGNAKGTAHYDNNQTVTLTATPYDNYSFDGWYQGDTLVSTNNPYTFRNTQPNEAQTFTARFSVLDWSRVAGYEAFNVEQSGSEIVIKSLKDATLTNIIIPEGATKIDNNAFENNTAITSVSIPNSVSSVGNGAFRGCTSLTSIAIPDAVTTIDANTFDNCSSLQRISANAAIASTIAKNCDSSSFAVVITSGTAIDESAFSATGLTSVIIPASVTIIGSSAFYNCDNLTSVTIGNGVTTIGSSAFRHCDGLASITVPDSVTGIGHSAFANCDNLTTVRFGANSQLTLLGANNNEGWDSGNGNVFNGCKRLTSLAIPNGVTRIERCTFQGCTALTSVTIPDSVVSMGYSAFYECSSLTSITVPDGIQIELSDRWSDGQFYGCSGLRQIRGDASAVAIIAGQCSSDSYTVTILSGTTIGENAFANRTGMTSITIADSVTSISTSAFYDCSGLASITVDSNNANFSSQDGILYNKAKTEIVYVPSEIQGEIAIPNGITTIKGSTFAYCTGITSITIPNSVTSIGYRAFYGAGLTSITIPDSVTSIGPYAFEDCTGLTSLTISNSVSSVGDGAFRGCTGLTTVNTGNGITSLSCFQNVFNENLTSIVIGNSITSMGIDVFKGCTSLTSVTFNDNFQIKDLYGFYGCTGLTSITIPNSVTSIGSQAFYGCTGLTSITIPNSVTSIGVDAFYNCTGLTSVTIPNSVTYIARGAFVGCGLTSVTIPNSVTSMDQGAFDNCTSLKSIIIGSGVSNSIHGPLRGCTNLESISVVAGNKHYHSSGNCLINTEYEEIIAGCKNSVIPTDGSVTSIGSDAFRYRTGLTSITIPNSVCVIRNSAFMYCADLASVVIPNSVTYILDHAFEGCIGLTSITFNGTMAQWNAIEKGYDWDNGTGNYTIYCTNGNISR